jgi:hypothetical protein
VDPSFLAPLYDTSGPCATVVLASGKHEESAGRELEVSWGHLREELAGGGTEPETLAALDAEVTAVIGGTAPEGLVLAAADGFLLLRHDLADPPQRNAVSPGPLPHVTELVRQAGRRRTHLVVTADRLGATVHGYGPLGEDLVSRGLSGGDLHIAKVKVGGWRHAHYQRRAENLWDSNAAQVAQDVERLAAALRPEVILLAGDVRARGLLVEHLSGPVASLVDPVEHPGGDEPTAEVVDQLVRAAAHRHAVEVLARLREELGRGGAAAAGLAATCAALRRGQVDTLILDETLLAAAPLLCVGRDLTQVAVDPADITDGESRQAAADDALIRAAAGQGAQLLAPGEPTELADGCAVLLRYLDAATGSETS